MLHIQNSRTRKKEAFTPIDPQKRRVTIYTCGPTVYDSLHLGHARAAIVPDVVRRYLEYLGYNVRFVMNFTDVDDKIIRRAIQEQRDWREITAQYIDEFHRLMMSLNVKPADVYPRATDHIAEMHDLVQRLVDGGYAYVAEDGDVYFDTSSFNNYGRLSGRGQNEDAGVSGRIADQRMAVKRNPGDFVLWKLSKNDPAEIADAGEAVPRWPSPWGDGRPGWHTECSAMSHQYLGVPFDIHCGGQDLLFPHHEDEAAQSECAYGDELNGRQSVNYWVHNGFITVKRREQDQDVEADLVDETTGGVKMSKSLGNVRWLREMIQPEGPFDPMAARMLMLGSHYRSPIVFEPALLDEATARLERIYNALEAVAMACEDISGEGAQPDAAMVGLVQKAEAAFVAAMDDDFNTAGALGALFELISGLNQSVVRARDSMDAEAAATLDHGATAVRRLLRVLGLRAERAASGGSNDADELLELLLETRQAARKAKQFEIADTIRDRLNALGYEIEDLPGGKWKVKKR